MDAIKQSSGSIIFLKSFLLAMILVMMSSFTSVQAADEKIGAGSNNNGSANKQIGVQNPSTDLWRAIRQRVPEGSNNSSSANQAKSMGLDSSSSTSLINTQGQEWRNFRMNKFIPLSMLLLAGVFLVLLLFRLIRGKIKIKSGRSGKKNSEV